MWFAPVISKADQAVIAGFLEGEACLTIREVNAGQSYSCGVYTVVRDDDREVLEWLVALTGLGRLHSKPARRTSRPQLCWSVATREDCSELLALLRPCGFHGRRAAELELWSTAVRVWVETSGDGRRRRLQQLKRRLEAARRFGCGASSAREFADDDHFVGYITGLVCAEGSFQMSRQRPRFSMHVRSDERPLLDLLARRTGFGKVTTHQPPAPLNPSATWTVAARDQLPALADLMRRGGLPGRKRKEMETWAVAVDELSSARRLGVRPRPLILDATAAQLKRVRTYRPPPQRALLETTRRDVRAEALAALRAWAAEAPGKLSCVSYTRWRYEGRTEHPTRNTITLEFGGWSAALVAAGLEDRVARAPRAPGGEAARARRRLAQRERVLAAVRRFEAEHGRAPAAMEFFRWCRTAAADSPSQASVYKLFAGGWQAVLAAR